MDKARKLAGDLLSKITKEGAYSGAELDQALFSGSLNDQDKAFVTELVYGTLARLYSIDEIIKAYSKIKLTKMEDQVLSSLRIAIYQILYLDKIPTFAAVDEAVTIVRKKSPKAAGFVNGMLRSILREEKELEFPDEVSRLSFAYSLRPELTRHFLTEYPEEAETILGNLVEPEGLSIRINEQKITAETYKKLLTDEGYEYTEGWFSPLFVYLNRQGAVRRMPGFAEGFFSVQNEAAALPPLILTRLVKEGTVLDLCASPGGKSAFMAEQSAPDFKVTAFDLSEHKLIRMRENFGRLGLSIETKAADAAKFLPEYEHSADGIILDVPCSGLGLIGRKPDIRLKMDLKAMAELTKLQAAILKNSARYLKTGGYLIYSTCTLNRAENQLNVLSFLKDHPEFSLLTEAVEALSTLAVSKGLDNLRLEQGMLTVLPGSGLDGFFVAVMKRS